MSSAALTDLQLSPPVLKGRGAIGSSDNRYERLSRVALDDGWSADEQPPPQTEVSFDRSKSIIVQQTALDLPFSQSLNVYRGCEHGCAYCFARPTHAYWGLAPGLDFETKLIAKPDAPRLLAEALRRKSYKVTPLAIGTNTDPYQPIERSLGLMRQVLEVLRDFRHPVGITTKAALITRDLDLLAPMAAQNLVRVAISVTTLDRDLARLLEPRAPTPARRIEAIRLLSDAGVPVAVFASPMIPGLNDHELEAILEAAAQAGARSASAILIRLPMEVAPLMEAWLHEHRPQRAERVLSLIRQCREGQLYKAKPVERFRGTGPVAEMIGQRLRLARTRYGLVPPVWELDCTRFAPPPTLGDQFTLFS
jgi:DNA repair photolyase